MKHFSFVDKIPMNHFLSNIREILNKFKILLLLYVKYTDAKLKKQAITKWLQFQYLVVHALLQPLTGSMQTLSMQAEQTSSG